MDLSNSTVKTPDAETETPTRVQPAKPHPFSNGVLKRHAPLNLHHHPVVVAFRECMKNHAASLGGHAVDGCGEFMPTPVPNPGDPTALKCAACGCHRNFHRREPEDPLLPTPPNAVPTFEYHPLHRHHPPPPPPPGTSDGSSPNNSPSPPPISSAYYPSAPHMLLALSHGGLAAAPPDGTTPISAIAATNSNSRKRFRTKFTQIQKEKMLEFAEKVGWKLQKRDEAAINEFCAEIGVEKGVLKVWMHNNKSTMGKKDHQIGTANPPPPATTNGEINYSATATVAAAVEDQFPETDDSKDNANELELSDNNDDSILGTANGSSSS